mmetsp:Transcript_83082/g.220442  ORF Transcript_83082/g.220442 Transcript_83082/m.220442 type:complete len:108 (-) Transcript_83082:186-509(-)
MEDPGFGCKWPNWLSTAAEVACTSGVKDNREWMASTTLLMTQPRGPFRTLVRSMADEDASEDSDMAVLMALVPDSEPGLLSRKCSSCRLFKFEYSADRPLRRQATLQ